VVFLESLESARARRVKIFGEILGSSAASDPSHALHFSEKENALSRGIDLLLSRLKIAKDEIDYINCHGTGTKDGDLYETHQIKGVFGKRAYKIPMSSTKSMTGHMLGASGAVEIIASLAAIKEGFIPPTAGLEKADPVCDLDYTPQKSKKAEVGTAVSVSMGFGGHVTAIAIREVT
jgi:3-oxoacyl-(acyl-carrier-protein) synthase